MASRKEGVAVVVSPSGRLNGVTAPALEAKLRDVAMHNDGCTVLDCREIVYISSAGLRAILIGAKVCMKEGGELVVAALQPECRAVMAASGLLTVVKYHRTVAAALAAGSSVDPAPEQGPGLEIGEWHDGGTAILSLNGRLDSRGAQVLMATISASVDSGRTRMMLDCGNLAYVNSAGLRALLIGAKSCQQSGGKLVIVELAPQCRSVMEMSGFLSVIDHRETRAEALEALSWAGGDVN